MLVDLAMALSDPSNWEPEPVGRQLERLRDELESLKAHAQVPLAPAMPPMRNGEDAASAEIGGMGGFFGSNPPPPADEEE